MGEGGVRSFSSLLSSRFLILGFVALLFGTFILSFNFANEYAAFNGEVPLTQLPSFKSMLKRTGVDGGREFLAQYGEPLDWRLFLKRQFSRIFGMAFPLSIPFSPGWWNEVLGVGVFSVCLTGLFFVRHKILMATLVLSGWCWALPMRYSSDSHEFESLFFIGIPLVFFSLVLLYLHKLFGHHLMTRLAVAALLLFILSSFHIGFRGSKVSKFHEATVALLPDHLIERILKGKSKRYEFHKAIIADFEDIRKIVGQGKIVFVSRYDNRNTFAFAGGAQYAPDYYLAGNVIEYRDEYQDERDRRALADFLIMSEREEGPALLTPDNRRMFLYDRAAYENES